MRWPSLEEDYWELESGEARHAEAPSSFWIPSRVEREAVQPGQAVKLLFAIEGEFEDGSIGVQVERMWVFVTERVADGFIGILDNRPDSTEPSPNAYLDIGVEVPFRPEHIIDIADPPQDYVTWQRSQPPSQTWPR
jgi:hypothetical protein